jgi:hypothetical protein
LQSLYRTQTRLPRRTLLINCSRSSQSLLGQLGLDAITGATPLSSARSIIYCTHQQRYARNTGVGDAVILIERFPNVLAHITAVLETPSKVTQRRRVTCVCNEQIEFDGSRALSSSIHINSRSVLKTDPNIELNQHHSLRRHGCIALHLSPCPRQHPFHKGSNRPELASPESAARSYTLTPRASALIHSSAALKASAKTARGIARITAGGTSVQATGAVLIFGHAQVELVALRKRLHAL